MLTIGWNCKIGWLTSLDGYLENAINLFARWPTLCIVIGRSQEGLTSSHMGIDAIKCIKSVCLSGSEGPTFLTSDISRTWSHQGYDVEWLYELATWCSVLRQCAKPVLSR